MTEPDTSYCWAAQGAGDQYIVTRDPAWDVYSDRVIAQKII